MRVIFSCEKVSLSDTSAVRGSRTEMARHLRYSQFMFSLISPI